MKMYLVEEDECTYSIYSTEKAAREYCELNELDYECIDEMQDGDTISFTVSITQYSSYKDN